jgi:acyl-coenzyme A synthetase/AMP-(fatty) acid ligase
MGIPQTLIDILEPIPGNQVHFAKSIPRTAATGKIQRRALAAAYTRESA